jgi:GT2 family glycosyltransferase
LLALLGQTKSVDSILVVDNASTDDTANLLASEFPSIEVLSMGRNVGSAGGFTAGIQRACEQKFEWIWTLDDDTIAQPDALQALFDARNRFELDHRPNLLASKVLWKDGSLHPMNLQKPKLYDAEAQMRAAEAGCMSIRFTSFVSMLMHRTCVFRYGLPIADYFLWNDDVEYSASILRSQLGVVVPSSVVTHATDKKYVPAKSVGKKFYFEVRNKIWLMRRSDSFSSMEKRIMAKSLLRRTWHHLVDSEFARSSISGVMRGIWDGIMSAPRANDRVLPRAVPIPARTQSEDETLSIAKALIYKAEKAPRIEAA